MLWAGQKYIFLGQKHIFLIFLIFPVIYQVCNLVTTATIKWITMCIRVRQTPPAEDVPRSQAPEIQHVGPTMV